MSATESEDQPYEDDMESEDVMVEKPRQSSSTKKRKEKILFSKMIEGRYLNEGDVIYLILNSPASSYGVIQRDGSIVVQIEWVNCSKESRYSRLSQCSQRI